MAGVGEEFWPREEELVMPSYPGLRGARKEASSLASYRYEREVPRPLTE